MVRHHDAVYERWCATIQRETRDLTSLSAVGARALADREVRSDPSLLAAIQSFIEARRAELHNQEATSQGRSRRAVVATYSEVATTPTRPSAQQTLLLFQKLVNQFRQHLQRFDGHEAEKNTGANPGLGVTGAQARD